MRKTIAIGFTFLALSAVACDKGTAEALSVPVPGPERQDPQPAKIAVSQTELTSADLKLAPQDQPAAAPAAPAAPAAAESAGSSD
jgi:hypothetical protein